MGGHVGSFVWWQVYLGPLVPISAVSVLDNLGCGVCGLPGGVAIGMYSYKIEFVAPHYRYNKSSLFAGGRKNEYRL